MHISSSIHHSWLLQILLTITLVVLFPLCILAQNISINDSLTATETSTSWRSPNGLFAFGFQQLQTNPNHFVLAIWFDNIPDKTIVWYERNSYPVPRASTLRLDPTEGLLLLDPQGSPLYTSKNDATFSDRVAQAFMQDNGNFLLTSTNSSNIMWESFRCPTDSILPSQTIEINGMIVSRRTQADLAQGRFRAMMNGSGDFFFTFKTVKTSENFDAQYYTSASSSQNSSNSGFRVRLNETGAVSVETSDGRTVTSLSDSSTQENYYRASLDFDGVFRVYYYPKIGAGDQRWSSDQQGKPSNPDVICRIRTSRGSSACGYNSICVVENDRPGCKCPRGFSLVDPNNTHGDCKSDYVQSCSDQDEECSLMEVPNVNWPDYDYEWMRVDTEQGCIDACLSDYACGAVVLGGAGCWKKCMPLTNGRFEQETKTFLKQGRVLNSNQTQNQAPQKPNDNNNNKKKAVLIVVGSVILGSSVLANLFFTISAFFRKTKQIQSTAPETNLRCFTYKQLVQATEGFKQELGRGAFGIVYKGVVMISDDSRTSVAVKKLKNLGHNSDKEFRTEVNIIGQIHHKNVVRLLGFCDEGSNRLLVYEHMLNGSLAGFLFGDEKPRWRQRAEIALGVARGLAYLHEECSSQIIHCDIKPQNILLDEYCTARISDFGLAKLMMLNQSRTLTNMRGTKGYMAPEWFRNTEVGAKVDVYSFGVVLLEIISCRKAVEFGGVENPILVDWAWQCFIEGMLGRFAEYDGEDDGGMVERFIKVGLWCIQEDAGVRPTMRQTCQMLEGTLEVEVPPWPPSFTFTSLHLT